LQLGCRFVYVGKYDRIIVVSFLIVENRAFREPWNAAFVEQTDRYMTFRVLIRFHLPRS
jgi:hypothetical protein